MPITKQIRVRQTVPDFACQCAGQLDALFEIAELNGISITEDVEPGTELLLNEADQRVITFFKNNTEDIVTDAHIPGGIDYMAVGVDFIVS